AFNEPGTSFDSVTRVVELTDQTVQAMKDGFGFESLEKTPKKAISMGIKSIINSKKIVLLVYGKSKAAALENLVKDEINKNIPASALKEHQNVVVIADEQARSLL